MRLDNTTNLFSCDFESLYTNINSNQAIEQICIFFQTKLNNQFDFSIKGLYEILKLILFNNIFSFNNKFFIQLNGLAMGTKCGPTIANIFIAILETKWLYLHKPLVYKRFIDDIFVITDKSNIESLEKNFGNLKLNLINDKEVQFLDLIISIDEYSNKLKFKLFTKSTNTFQYLFYNSNHPNHIFSNIPKSLFIRIRRICSDYTDYLYYSRRLIVQLLKRGYKFENLLKISLEIGNIDRNKLIPYKDKRQLSSKYSQGFKFIINYDLNYLDLKKDFFHCTTSLKEKFKWLDNYKFNALFSSSSNLNDIFINKGKIDANYSGTTLKCNSDNCNTCNFIYLNNFIQKNSFKLPLLNNTNCESENVIYILICLRCEMYYIGQTGRSFKMRFNEHIRNIHSFKNLKKFNTEVSIHFNKKGHDYNRHIKFCIFNKNIDLLSDRLSMEADLINIFIFLKLNLINSFIPYIKELIKSL